MNGQVWIAVLVGLAATIDDLARRQIANWIPVAALAAGLCWNIAQNGWRGALQSLAGAVAGFAVFLIFYLAGGMGAGDIKLMTGFGALLGAIQLLKAAMWTAGVTEGMMWRATQPDGSLTYSFLDSLIAIRPDYFFRWFGGVLIWLGMWVMAWNLWHTAADARARLIKPIPVPIPEPAPHQVPAPLPASAG